MLVLQPVVKINPEGLSVAQSYHKSSLSVTVMVLCEHKMYTER